MADALLKVSDLSASRFARRQAEEKLLSDISLEIHGGETVGIVGDSGTGKSLLLASLLNVLREPVRTTGGSVMFGGDDLRRMSETELNQIRGKEIGFIGANPHTLLNPLVPVGKQVANFLRAHEPMSKNAATERVYEMFHAVGIPDAKRRLKSYPHELSGGMAQRVVISIGLICSPRLILADEPTFGLDVTIQAQVLKLIHDLVVGAEDRAMLIVTRDLAIIANYADTVHVMHGGAIIESGPVDTFFHSASSEHARVLIGAAQLERHAVMEPEVRARA